MKKNFLLLIFLILGSAMWTNVKAAVDANAYAYSFTAGTFSTTYFTQEVTYKLNAKAGSVTFKVNGNNATTVTSGTNLTVVGSTSTTLINAGARTAYLKIDPAWIVSNASGSCQSSPQLSIEITVNRNGSISANSGQWDEVTVTPGDGRFNFPRGLTVDNSFDSPNCGTVYVMEGKDGLSSSGRTTSAGLYILNAELATSTLGSNAAGNRNIASTSTFKTTNYNTSPGRVTVAPDGTVFISDVEYDNKGLWWIDFFKPYGDPSNAAGTGLANTKVFSNSESDYWFTRPVISCVVAGTGANQKIYTIETYRDGTNDGEVTRDTYTGALFGQASGAHYYNKFNNNAANHFQILRYNAPTTSRGVQPQLNQSNKIERYRNSAVLTSIDYPTSMKAGKYGTKHLWVSQQRPYYTGKNDNWDRAFLFFKDRDADGVAPTMIAINTGDRSGIFAVSPDGSLIASARLRKHTDGGQYYHSYGNASVDIYKVTYDASDNPTLATHIGGAATGNSMNGTDNDISEMAFDWGNNLYVISCKKQALSVYAITGGNTFKRTITTTVPSSPLLPPLSGTYYLPDNTGSLGRNFASLKDFCTVINAVQGVSCGITGNIELIVNETANNKTITVEDNVGLVNSTNYSITIKSATTQSLPSRGCNSDARTFYFPVTKNNGQNLNSDCPGTAFSAAPCAKIGTATSLPTRDLGPDGCFAIGCKHDPADGMLKWGNLGVTNNIFLENLRFRANNWNNAAPTPQTSQYQRNNVLLVINACDSIIINNCEVYKGDVTDAGVPNFNNTNYVKNSYNDCIGIFGSVLPDNITNSTLRTLPNRVKVTNCKIVNANVSASADELFQGHGINSDVYYRVDSRGGFYGHNDNDPSGVYFPTLADNKSIKLTVTNCHIQAKQAGICANLTSDAKITRNTIIGHRHGVYSGKSVNPVISNNPSITAPMYAWPPNSPQYGSTANKSWGSNGIRISMTTGAKILNNGEIKGNDYGTVWNTTVTPNAWDVFTGNGIFIDGGSNNSEIANDTIIEGGYGIRIENSDYTKISNSSNRIKGTYTDAIYCSNVKDAHVKSNTLIDAASAARGNGITMTTVEDPIIEQNATIRAAAGHGIYCYKATKGAKGGLQIKNNTIAITGGTDGINVDAGSQEPQIRSNTKIQGARQGIRIESWWKGGGAADITTPVVANNATIIGADDGVWVQAITGNVLVDQNTSITGTNDRGVYMTAVTGNATVTNNPKIIGGNNGISMNAVTGTALVDQNGNVDGIIGSNHNGILMTDVAKAVIKRNPIIVGGGIDGISITRGANHEITDNDRITGGRRCINIFDTGTATAIERNTDIRGPVDGIYLNQVVSPTIRNNTIEVGQDGIYMTGINGKPTSNALITLNEILGRRDGISIDGTTNISGVASTTIIKNGYKNRDQSPDRGYIHGYRHAINLNSLSGATIQRNWIKVGQSGDSQGNIVNAGVYGRANLSGGINVIENRFVQLLTGSKNGDYRNGVTGVYATTGQSWNIENNCFSGFGCTTSGGSADKASFNGVRISSFTPPNPSDPAHAPALAPASAEQKANFAPPSGYPDGKIYVRHNTIYLRNMPGTASGAAAVNRRDGNVSNPIFNDAAYAALALDAGVTSANALIENNLLVSREKTGPSFLVVGNESAASADWTLANLATKNNIFSVAPTAYVLDPDFSNPILHGAEIMPKGTGVTPITSYPGKTENGVSLEDPDKNKLWVVNLAKSSKLIVPLVSAGTINVDIDGLSRISTAPGMSGNTLAGAYAFDPSSPDGIFTDIDAIAVGGIRVICLGNRISILADKAIQSVKLFDIQGRVVASELVSSNAHSLTAPASGVYFVETTTTGGRNIQKVVATNVARF